MSVMNPDVKAAVDQISLVMGAVSDYKNSPASIMADLWHWCAEHKVSFEQELIKMRTYVDADLDEVDAGVEVELARFMKVV